MSLVKEEIVKVYDTDQIRKGYLLYAKHKTWREGKSGFVTSIKETEIIVQFQPDISNVTNHFFLPIHEVLAGEWKIRWSEDLSMVYEFVIENESEDIDES